MCILGLVTGQLPEEFARAGFGDGADVLHHFIPRHANAVVGNGDGAGGFVDVDANFQIGIVTEQRLIFHRLEAQLIAGVRRVGNQFAQKNLLVAVQGVNHKVEQLLDLGLEAQGFFSGFGLHGCSLELNFACRLGLKGVFSRGTLSASHAFPGSAGACASRHRAKHGKITHWTR